VTLVEGGDISSRQSQDELRNLEIGQQLIVETKMTAIICRPASPASPTHSDGRQPNARTQREPPRTGGPLSLLLRAIWCRVQLCLPEGPDEPTPAREARSTLCSSSITRPARESIREGRDDCACCARVRLPGVVAKIFHYDQHKTATFRRPRKVDRHHVIGDGVCVVWPSPARYVS
jgi:hypothetical protein